MTRPAPPPPLSPAAAARPRNPSTGRVLAELRAEVKLHRAGRAGDNGLITGYRAYFESFAEVAAWMTSDPGFLETADRVREIVIVRHNPDPGPAE